MTTDDRTLERKARRRIRRIDATQRWSRMKGWGGLVPGQLLLERKVLSDLLESA